MSAWGTDAADGWGADAAWGATTDNQAPKRGCFDKLFELGIHSGINFDSFDKIPVSTFRLVPALSLRGNFLVTDVEACFFSVGGTKLGNNRWKHDNLVLAD